MTDTDEGSGSFNNQRVTNALLKKDIGEISKQIDKLAVIPEQLHTLDLKLTKFCGMVDSNKEDIEDLKSDITFLERRDWIGAFVATTAATLIGFFTGRQ